MTEKIIPLGRRLLCKRVPDRKQSKGDLVLPVQVHGATASGRGKGALPRGLELEVVALGIRYPHEACLVEIPNNPDSVNDAKQFLEAFEKGVNAGDSVLLSSGGAKSQPAPFIHPLIKVGARIIAGHVALTGVWANGDQFFLVDEEYVEAIIENPNVEGLVKVVM